MVPQSDRREQGIGKEVPHRCVLAGHRPAGIGYGGPVEMKWKALLPLALLAPAPTLGIASVLIWWPGPVGRFLFTAAKVWLVLFPVIWRVFVEKRPISWSPPRRGGLAIGALVGTAMAGVIAAAYLLIAVGHVDPSALREEVIDMGLARPETYIAGALYWIFVNSVVEEYVFRWFITSRCEAVWSKPVAVAVSALIFTVHHAVAMATYFSPGLTALASFGIFVAGAVWSAMYARYRSIWPGWIAHAFADVAVFGCGWLLLFG